MFFYVWLDCWITSSRHWLQERNGHVTSFSRCNLFGSYTPLVIWMDTLGHYFTLGHTHLAVFIVKEEGEEIFLSTV